MSEQTLDAVPMWAFFLMACLLVVLPLQAGNWLGRRQSKRFPGHDDQAAIVFVGSILALFGFLLAFTFSMAASRFEERRQAVLQEANAIGTAYLRTQVLPEPVRTEAAGLLREYVDVRLQHVQSDGSSEGLARAIARSEDIHQQLWARAMSVAEQAPTVMTGLFIQALNAMIDVHSERVQIGVRTRIPLSIWLGLFIVALIALTSAGYQAAVGGKTRSPVMFALVPAFAGVLTMIADLDNPRQGFVRNSQFPLIELQRTMNSD